MPVFEKRLKIFTLRGIPIRVDLSWLVILALVVWSLSAGVFPTLHPGHRPAVYVAMGLAGALGLFASIVFHEMCHSLVARRFGTRIRGITLFIFGGVAEMEGEPLSPKSEFLMAAAGPLSSYLAGLAFLGAAALGGPLHWPAPVTAVLGWLGLINAILATFNLIPGFPLDGGRVLRSALWHWKGDLAWATRVAAAVGGGFGLALVGLGVLNIVFLNPIGGLWWILIGLFLRSAAKQSYQQAVIRRGLEGQPVSRIMEPPPVAVAPSVTLAELVEDYILKHHHTMFPVVGDGRLLGSVSTGDVKGVPRELWPARTVAEALRPCTEANTIGPREDALGAMARMSARNAECLLVVEDGRLVGLLTLKGLLAHIALQLELARPR